MLSEIYILHLVGEKYNMIEKEKQETVAEMTKAGRLREKGSSCRLYVYDGSFSIRKGENEYGED